MIKEKVKLDSVKAYNDLYGLPTLHPLVTVVDLKEASKIVNNVQMDYEIYALFLKCNKNCNIIYGRQQYDFQEGTIVCFAPGQTATVETIEDEVRPDAYGLLFHPDAIRGTQLAKTIRKFTYFSYAVNEALHISETEKAIVLDCLNKIAYEFNGHTDNHSKQLISMNIELLLNYCLRFYERQFAVRKEASGDALTQFEHLLNEYFEDRRLVALGLPTVKYFAEKLCLTPNYFGDLVKKVTGKAPVEHIQAKCVAQAKHLLAETDGTVSEIAYSLGFQYPHHLCRIFKKLTGMTPNEYRKNAID